MQSVTPLKLPREDDVDPVDCPRVHVPPEIPKEKFELDPRSSAHLSQLARRLCNQDYIVFITGAGLSAPSGIRPYRAAPDALWNDKILHCGTLKYFLAHPKLWWNEFWLKTHGEEALGSALPNNGHKALAQIMNKFPNTRLITQNVDGLHKMAGFAPSDRYAEVHGCSKLLRCTNKDCPYATHKYYTYEDITISYDNDGMMVPPTCPRCGKLLVPMALMFDEKYTCHEYFGYAKAEDWIERADAVVFIGTSLSVGITEKAVTSCSFWGTEAYMMNITPQSLPDGPYDVTDPHNIVGNVEQSLPLLEQSCSKMMDELYPPSESPLSVITSFINDTINIPLPQIHLPQIPLVSDTCTIM